MSPLRTALAGAVALVATAALSTTALTAPALAANGTVGERETVCANDLYVRTAPNDGPWMGTLTKGQTFLVKGPKTGNYVYGFAYGHINAHGWVVDGWFC